MILATASKAPKTASADLVFYACCWSLRPLKQAQLSHTTYDGLRNDPEGGQGNNQFAHRDYRIHIVLSADG